MARQEEAECGSPGCRGAWVEAMVSQRPRKERGGLVVLVVVASGGDREDELEVEEVAGRRRIRGT